MADPAAFLRVPREERRRTPAQRLQDWREVHLALPDGRLQQQAERCMGCGIPFCHEVCPLGNLIPEWNELVARGAWRRATERLHATNNFPEFTGTLCPAPCEDGCVLAINAEPVTIKQIELQIVDRAWQEGWITPCLPVKRTGRAVAVVGSGPAGLAAAQQLTRAGHEVVVFERADRIGGLLRYGIPEFKLEKRRLDRRLVQMHREGTIFRAGIEVGVDYTVDRLRSRFDAVVLASGATVARDLPVAGRDLHGVHLAMEYLTWANRVRQGDVAVSPITAEGVDVVIIGGGDTGTDCFGTALRQQARSVVHIDIRARPPDRRSPQTPWPTYPAIYRTAPAHEEGGLRRFSLATLAFLGDAQHRLRGVQVVDGFRDEDRTFHPRSTTVEQLPAQLALVALGFVGTEHSRLLTDLDIKTNTLGTIAREDNFMSSTDGVFIAGDAGRGPSLIVWAIAEGRSAAANVDTGRKILPQCIHPTDQPIR
jgi:glutamate synthase (NADPH) small chain